MITKITADKRYKADHDWLQTYHLFSFADYYDPENLHFGNLRVFNDDTIAGQNGFGAHSHANMEIVTVVFKGTLTHKDSMGNNGTISAGEVQYMSAGTGVTHAELNEHDETVQLYQIWIMPREQNLTPKYDQKDFSTLKKNVLNPLASGAAKFANDANVIKIISDTTIFSGELEASASVTHALENGNGLFIYVSSGEVKIGDETFQAGDQARITGEAEVAITAATDAKFIAIETTNISV